MNGFLLGLIIFLTLAGITAYVITVKMSSGKKSCNPECGPGKQCSNGKCVDSPCSSNDQCLFHQVCHDNTQCIDCNTDKDCAWNKYAPACLNGGTPYSSCVACTSDKFCTDPPGKCISNVCHV